MSIASPATATTELSPTISNGRERHLSTHPLDFHDDSTYSSSIQLRREDSAIYATLSPSHRSPSGVTGVGLWNCFFGFGRSECIVNYSNPLRRAGVLSTEPFSSTPFPNPPLPPPNLSSPLLPL